MKNIIVCNASSEKCLIFFREHYEEFKPVIKVTSFFDPQNFLFTDYNVENESIHTVIENNRGEQMHLSGLNCGYGGVGPSATCDMLRTIGINVELAKEYVLNPAFECIYNENNDTYSFHALPNFFVYNNETKADGKFRMTERAKVDSLRKSVYMINPQYHDFPSLINCFPMMKPLAMEYYIGQHESLEQEQQMDDIFDFSQYTLRNENLKTLHGANLIIRGKFFDVYCFIDYDNLIAVANTLYTYIFKKQLYTEKFLGSYTLLIPTNKNSQKDSPIIQFIKWLFNKDKHSKCSYRFTLTDEEVRRWEI